MKRILCCLFILILLPVVSLADLPDISGLSFDELVQLREQLNLAIWNSQEWQRVTVPAGAYEIGVDIPEGYWTMTPNYIDDTVVYIYCDELNETRSSYSDDCDIWETYYVSRETYGGTSWKDNSKLHELSLDMKSGRFIIIPCETFFTPYTGKPDLGFK